MKRFYLIFFLTALAVIEYLATTTHNIPVIEHSWDKLNHAVAFSVLYLLLLKSFNRWQTPTKVGILIALALQIEITQYFIAGRCFSLSDIIADGIGVIVGMSLQQLFPHHKPTSRFYIGQPCG
jgi:VanZ family protein